MPEVKIGDIVVGRYKIERLIARGGFGDVYLATRLNQNVFRALKILRRDSMGMGEKLYLEVSERFMIEARLGARLNSPNIIKVEDYGQDGMLQVLAMEYAPGGNLADRLSNKPGIPVGEAIQITAEIAGGLAVLHAQDVVHRDLKPSNILFDARGVAKVADLGLAQLPGGVSMRSRNGSEMSGNMHPGTRAYMSPEQENSTGYLRSSSDVYALGVILFELLTGRNVKNLKAGISAGELRSGVPGWLDDLLQRMLSREPERRPADGKEVLEALQAGIAPGHSTPSAQPVSKPIAAVPAPRQVIRKWMPGIIAVAVLITAGIVIASLAVRNRSQTPTIAAASPQAAGAGDTVVEYVVSSANSMLQPLNGISKQNMVRNALGQHWSTWTTPKNGAGAALRVFGSQYSAAEAQKSCLDTKLLSAPVQTPSTFSSSLNTSEARGLAPLAETLFATAGDFNPQQKKSVVLITDSGDTCGGDPCNWAATQYRDAGLSMPIYVLDLGGKSGLNCLADASGGKYYAINDQNGLIEALNVLENAQKDAVSESGAASQAGSTIVPTQGSTIGTGKLFEGQITYTGADNNIYVLRSGRLDPIQITNNGSETTFNINPQWSQDGKKLAYLSGNGPIGGRGGPYTLYITNPDDNHPIKMVDGLDTGMDWSPDGKSIIFDYYYDLTIDKNGKGIGLLDINTGAVKNIVPPQAGILQWDPQWSPNGLWIKYYDLHNDGPLPCYLYSVTKGEISSMSTNKLSKAMIFPDFIKWSPDGSQLIFTNAGQGKGFFVKLYSTSPDEINPQQFFDMQNINPESRITNILWAPDGKQIYLGWNFYSSDGFNQAGSIRINADGSSLTQLTDVGIPLAFSPDGHQFILQRMGLDKISELQIFDLDTQKLIKTGNQVKGVGVWNRTINIDWGILP